MMVEVYFSLGSNLGDRKINILQAIRMMEDEFYILDGQPRPPVAISKLIETEPWGFESKDKFINSVAVFETLLSPLEALKVCNETEYALGRRRNNEVGYSSRTIDIDILFCEDRIISTEQLQVPHPLIDKRNFVLIPLKEIVPDFVHPLLNKKIKDI